MLLQNTFSLFYGIVDVKIEQNYNVYVLLYTS